MSSDEEQPLHERIKLTRRKTLASLGAMAGGASLASGQLDNDEQENLAAGGMATALGQQYARERYFTSPDAAVDTSQMKAGEKMHVTDTGEFFVWDGSAKEYVSLGSSSNPVPSVTTEQATVTNADIDSEVIGNEQRWWPENRPLYSNDIIDYTASSIADAQEHINNNLAIIQNHRFKVTLPSGTHTTGLDIPPSMSPYWARGGGNGLRVGIVIEGANSTDRTATTLPYVAGGGVTNITVRSLQTNGDASSEWDESGGILFYHSQRVSLNSVGFAGGNDGAVAYNSYMHLDDVDFGASALTNAIRVKHNGGIQEESTTTPATTGTVTGTAYTSGGGDIYLKGSSTLSGSTNYADGARGRVYDYTSDIEYRGTSVAVYQAPQGGRPTPETSVAYYLDDGSATPTAGWYLTTDGGTNWTAV